MTRPVAMIFVLAGASFMSFVGVLMRLLDDATGFQILFYRSISLTLIVLVVICFRRHCTPKALLQSIDRHDLWVGGWLALAFTSYIFSMLHTSVASTLLILTIVPFLAAIIAWKWSGEIPHAVTWPTMIVAIFGVGLMVYDGASLGYSLGNISAFISAGCFAIMLVIARRSRKADILGGTFMAGIFSAALGAIAAFLLDGGIGIKQTDLFIILFMGAFTIGLGIALVTAGTGYLPAAEVSLLVLIESVLGPLWPWVFLGEALTNTEIIGGAITLAAVIAMTIASHKQPAVTPLAR
jgi:DME family drug/metabolite transporter